MGRNARKYMLVIDTIRSCGLGTLKTDGIQHNLLNTFTVYYAQQETGNGITYPQITIQQLQSMSVTDYIKRVTDFLIYLNVDDITIKNYLINNSIYAEPDCGSFCGLNPDYIIYKFLSGIRIVHIGTVSGVAEYKVYPSGSDPSLYPWVTTATFLNLDPNGVYMTIVRDIKDNTTICEYSKIFSMILLYPQTTQPYINSLISINESTCGNYNNMYYETGYFNLNPSLSGTENVCVNYSTVTDLLGSGSASVSLSCKPNGSDIYSPYVCYTNLNGPKNRSSIFNLFAGDSMCYNISALASSHGSSAQSSLSINSVCGTNLGANYDITRFDSNVFSNWEKENIVVSLYETMSGTSTGGTPNSLSIRYGLIDFNTPIPTNEHINVGLSGVSTSYDGTSEVVFYCKPSGGTEYLEVCSINNILSQPQLPEITAHAGDSLCWMETLTAINPGSCASNIMCLNNLTSSIGINPTRSLTYNCVSKSISQASLPVVINLCVNTAGSVDNVYCMNSGGIINTVPTLTGNQTATINFNSEIYVNDNCSTGIPFGCLNVYRKPLGGAKYVSVCKLCQSNVAQSGSVSMIAGDSICYSLCSVIGSCIGDSSTASILLSGANGGGGISPSISAIKYCDSVSKL